MPNSKSSSDKNSPEENKPLEYSIPLEGSLGVLALGAVGIKAWREAIKTANKKLNKKPNSES